MTRTGLSRVGKSESGQTIVMVALSIVALMAVAALGIDVATLYTARAEAQRTADAAALAGAKAFVDTGLTSFRSTDLNFTNVQTAAQAIATAQVAQIVQANKIAGAPGTGTPSFPPTNPDGNPQITVTVQRTGLPTFFARVLGPHLTSVSATARAEAFNPSFSSSNPSGFTPVAAKCVKPFVIPNTDPNRGGTPFIDASTGVLASPNPLGETLTLVSDCIQSGSGCSLINNPPKVCGGDTVQYLPTRNNASTPMLCPTCGSGATTFEQNISCCNTHTFTCSSSIGGASTWEAALTVNPNGSSGPTQNGLRCAIHQSGSNGQDILAPSTPPFGMQAGPNNPLVNASLVSSGDAITTSSSVMTLAVYDQTQGISPLHVIGFLQVFVTTVDGNKGSDCGGGGSNDDDGDGAGGGGGRFHVTILNVSGCGSNTFSGTPVAGGGVSSIPVRLMR